MCKFKCPHLNCKHSFLTKKGMLIHAGTCKWKDEFELERVLSHRGPVTNRSYLVKRKDYADEETAGSTA